MSRHECGFDHQDNEIAEARCGYERALARNLRDYASELDRPPTPSQVDDLWAHARTIQDDGRLAARWVRHVLDLGWRPGMGIQ